MDFQKAIEIKEKNQHLLGMESPKGGTIDEIILVPTNGVYANQFQINYIQCLDGDLAIAPFIGQDVNILVVVDKYRINTESIFLFTDLLNLPEEYNIITD